MMVTSQQPPALAFHGVSRAYTTAAGPRYALRDVTVEIPPGSRVAVMGRSGSGKSTFLHLAAGIDTPTAGVVRIAGQDLATLSERRRTLLRRREIGLIFQFFHLLPHLGVRDNVLLPAWIAGVDAEAAQQRTAELLERVGLADRGADAVQKLSGGEQQRVAICRALLLRPRLLLADEPTGNLDDATGERVMDLLLEVAAEESATLIYVTHSQRLATRAEVVWRLTSGVLEASSSAADEER